MIRVLANGCFDCLHVGHVNYLLAAAQLGDHLAVALTIDEFVNKGPGRPVFSYRERYITVGSLFYVNLVFAASSGQRAVLDYRPDIYVKGKDWEGRLPEQAFVESYGGRVVFIDAPVYSSTKILTGELLRERIRTDRERQDEEGSLLR